MKLNPNDLQFTSHGGFMSEATLLDFFAAHAPLVIPAWFNVEYTDAAPRTLGFDEALQLQQGFADLPPEQQQELISWMREGTWDLEEGRQREIGEAAAQMRRASFELAEAVKVERELDRIFLWRWYYAHQMVSRRPA